MMLWNRPKHDDARTHVHHGPDHARSDTLHGEHLLPLPVLDRGVYDSLAEELDNPTGALQFATLFARMLPERIAGIEEAFRSQDSEAAVVTILSLNVSASMVGARRLAEYSSVALDLVTDPTSHAALVDRLRALAGEFQSALAGIIR